MLRYDENKFKKLKNKRFKLFYRLLIYFKNVN